MTALYAALRDMLPADIALAAGPHDSLAGELWPQERDLVKDAVDKRVREFRAGRAAARLALADLGHPAAALLKRQNRTPVWPQGILGSISHSITHAAAIVAPSNSYAGLGIDIEPDGPVDDALRDRLLRPEERGSDGSPKLKFSIKEAGFKALYPQYGRFIEFHQAVTDVDPFNGRFTIELLLDDWPGPTRLTGNWTIASGHCAAIVTRRA